MDIARSELERWFNQHHPGARADLGGTMVPGPRERLARLLRPEHFDAGYPPTDGSGDVRARIAGAEGLGADDLVLTCGATEANAASLLAAARRGGVAVVQHPIYYQFEPLLEAHGVRIRRWDPAAPGPPPLDSDTCLVVINSPHNPTGMIVDLDPVVRRAEALPDCRVLVDEVYRQVTPDGLRPAATLSERVVATNSFAKRWGLPGLRLGWAACRDRAFRDRIHAWHHFLAHSPPGPSERLVGALWSELDVARRENQAIAVRNTALVGVWLARSADLVAAELPRAGVAMLVVPKLPGYDGDDVALAERLRQEAGVFVLPGSFVGYPGTLRIGFGHREADDLLAALAGFEAGLRSSAARAAGSAAGRAAGIGRHPVAPGGERASGQDP